MAYTIDLTKITQFDHVEFVAKQVVEGFITGIHKSPMHGFSVEFAEHRPYNTGEPIRHIDWKLYARTDKLFVKQYEEETNLRCHLVIDNSSSMYFPKRQKYTLAQPNKIFFAVYAAAVLMQVFKSQRDAVGLSLFSDKLELHTRARGGDAHHKMIYRELEKDDDNFFDDYSFKYIPENSMDKTGEELEDFINSLTALMNANQGLDEYEKIGVHDKLHFFDFRNHLYGNGIL